MKTSVRTPKPGAWAGVTRTPHALIVAGIMSGTSADGIDVAFTRISPTPTSIPRIKLLGHRAFPFPRLVREAVFAAMDASSISTAELSRLHWRLGELYADAVQKTSAQLDLEPDLIGLHGQTIYHQAAPAPYLGKPIRSTWQIGEPAILRERLGVPVVSDFRPADLAAGGQGAPLVPMLDFCLFRSPKRNRLVLNLGGIANLTVLPAAAGLEDLIAFDTGPANMLLDALMEAHLGKPFDRNGATSAKGKLLPQVLATLLRDPYFTAAPPKSCGREQFGADFLTRLQALSSDADPRDLLATASELTSASILDAYTRFCAPRLPPRPTELIVSGGGTRNRHLMQRLREVFAPRKVKVLCSDDLGLPSQAKESVAFALLAWLSFHGLPGNVPSATGASRPAVLGRLTL